MGRGAITGLGLVLLAYLTVACATAAPPTALKLVDGSPIAYAVKRVKPGTFRLAASGPGAPSRTAVEQFLAFNAAQLTVRERGGWFEIMEPGAKPAAAPAVPGKRYSFRMDSWRPAWRYRTAAGWREVDDVPPASVQAFEAVATIVIHQGPLQAENADNARAFDAWALSDYLREQVQPPSGPAAAPARS